MNQLPIIKQKPTLKPKPSVKPNFSSKDKLSHTTNESNSIDKTNDLNSMKLNDEKEIEQKLNNLKLNKSIESSELKIESKFSQKVLDKNQLNKAFQLLNQNNLPTDKDTVQYDIRVDEDQIETCNQIIKILFDAGYLRANIIGLSEFDKIIGGMCWCIELCNIDIDIDLFYQDTLTIGQKIALTEKIVKVLNIMKCPHQIEAHQIQGLDCINILPTVQWLIKESREFGIQIKDYIDMFAAYKFDCDHGLFKNHEDLLVISRSKEVKKIIKEYFNKNEIKINLEFKIDEYERDLENLARLDQQLDKDKEELNDEIISKEKDIERIEAECKKLTEELSEHQSSEKKQLALDYSKLIDEFKLIKSNNKATKSKMKKEYENLLESTNIEMDDDQQEQLKFEKSKLNKIRSKLAEKNKNYLALRRKYDNELSKEEMNQYQKRFIELSGQVANKLNETKKFFILYNQLDSTKKQLENKFQFFESLLKCYNQLNPSTNNQMNQQFFMQLEQKINSLNSTFETLKSMNQTESNRKQKLELQYVELIEMKRLYYKRIRELKEEMMNKSI